MIAASAPTKNTVPHFLQMIIENRVSLIMKVCDFKVHGMEQCAKYLGKNRDQGFFSVDKLVNKINGTQNYKPTLFHSQNGKKTFKVQAIKITKKLGGNLVIRKMKVTYQNYKNINTINSHVSVTKQESEGGKSVEVKTHQDTKFFDNLILDQNNDHQMIETMSQ